MDKSNRQADRFTESAIRQSIFEAVSQNYEECFYQLGTCAVAVNESQVRSLAGSVSDAVLLALKKASR